MLVWIRIHGKRRDEKLLFCQQRCGGNSQWSKGHVSRAAVCGFAPQPCRTAFLGSTWTAMDGSILVWSTPIFSHTEFHITNPTHGSLFWEWCQIRGLQFPWVIHGDPTPHDGTLVHLSSEALKGFFWLFHHRETNRISTRIVPSMAFLSMSDLKLTSATASMKIASLILPNHAHSNFLMSCSNKREGIDKPGSKREQSWTSKVKHEDSSPS